MIPLGVHRGIPDRNRQRGKESCMRRCSLDILRQVVKNGLPNVLICFIRNIENFPFAIGAFRPIVKDRGVNFNSGIDSELLNEFRNCVREFLGEFENCYLFNSCVIQNGGCFGAVVVGHIDTLYEGAHWVKAYWRVTYNELYHTCSTESRRCPPCVTAS